MPNGLQCGSLSSRINLTGCASEQKIASQLTRLGTLLYGVLGLQLTKKKNKLKKLLPTLLTFCFIGLNFCLTVLLFTLV